MNELKHHGIKGQKWGVRRGTRYPLQPDQHSAAEKKANNKKTISGYLAETAKNKHIKNRVDKKTSNKKIEESKRTKRLKKKIEISRLRDELDEKDLKKGKTGLFRSNKTNAEIQYNMGKRSSSGKRKVGSIRTQLLQKRLHESEVRDMINAGSSKMKKVWNKITAGDKYAAQAYISAERHEKKQAAKRATKKRKENKK